MLDLQELTEARDTALAIAREAGALLMSGWRKNPHVSKKGTIDLVTEFDLRSETLLRERLGRAFPNHTIVAEEGAVWDILAVMHWEGQDIGGSILPPVVLIQPLHGRIIDHQNAQFALAMSGQIKQDLGAPAQAGKAEGVTAIGL